MRESWKTAITKPAWYAMRPALPAPPKTGVAAEWEPRMAKGMDVLVESVDKGMGAMPPKGMCFDCSADDFKALIEYMATAK